MRWCQNIKGGIKTRCPGSERLPLPTPPAVYSELFKEHQRMLERNPWSPSSEVHVIISQLSSLGIFAIDMTSLWEHHASPSSNWALAWASIGVLICNAWLPTGPLGSQTKASEPALALLTSENQLIHPGQVSFIVNLCDLEQVFAASESPMEALYQSWTSDFYCGKLLQEETIFVHMHVPCTGTEKQNSNVPVLRSNGGVKILGMWKLVKLLERWTENRSMEIPLYFSAASGSKSFGLSWPLFLQPLCSENKTGRAPSQAG